MTLDDGDDDGSTADAPIIEDPVYQSGGCGFHGGAGDVYSTKRDVPTTVGTAYPVENDRAWMNAFSGASTEDRFIGTLGFASNLGGASYSETGTKTVEKTVGFDWDPKSFSRSFALVSYIKEWTTTLAIDALRKMSRTIRLGCHNIGAAGSVRTPMA